MLELYIKLQLITSAIGLTTFIGFIIWFVVSLKKAVGD